MNTSYWETEQKVFEARVYSNSGVSELHDVLARMKSACHFYNGNTEALSFRIDGEAVVIFFNGESSSIGWSPDE